MARFKELTDFFQRVGGIGRQRYLEVFAKAPSQTWFNEYEYPLEPLSEILT